MDTFDNTGFEEIPDENLNAQEEPAAEEPAAGAYRSHGTGRKESPYADSPYEMHQQSQQEYRYHPQNQRPAKPRKEKKPRKGIWKGILFGRFRGCGKHRLQALPGRSGFHPGFLQTRCCQKYP